MVAAYSWCIEVSCECWSSTFVKAIVKLMPSCFEFISHNLWNDVSLNFCIKGSWRCLCLSLDFNTLSYWLLDQADTLSLLIGEFNRIHLHCRILCCDLALNTNFSRLYFNLGLIVGLFNVHRSAHIHRFFLRLLWKKHLDLGYLCFY